MLRWARRHPWLSGAFATSVVLLVLFALSYCVQRYGYLCEYQKENNYTRCDYYHLGPYALLWAIEVIDRNNGFVVAVATGIMAVFTGTLWFVTNQAVRLSREEFLASHRPELDIQFIRRTPENAALLADQQPVGANFTIVNNGGSEAHVTGSRFSLAWLETTDIPTPNDLIGQDIIPHRRFLVGATDRVTVWSNNLGGLAEAEALPNRRLFLMGWMVYRDASGPNEGSPRTGYFLRVFDPQTRLFDDPRLRGGIDWEWNTTQ